MKIILSDVYTLNINVNINFDARIVIDYSIVTLQFVASISENSRVVIYDHNMLIVQATGVVLC